MDENYYTTRDAAQLLGVSVRTVQQWVEKGALEGWKTDGGHRRIKRSSVEHALLTLGQHPTPACPEKALRVLVVEDNLALLKLYRTLIKQWSLPTTVSTASNGFEALVMMGEVAPDLLICDLRLPGVNGFQIVRALCEMPRFGELAIVVVSGMPSNEIAAHGNLPKHVQVMAKPIDTERLKQTAQAVWRTKMSLK